MLIILNTRWQRWEQAEKSLALGVFFCNAFAEMEFKKNSLSRDENTSVGFQRGERERERERERAAGAGFKAREITGNANAGKDV